MKVAIIGLVLALVVSSVSMNNIYAQSAQETLVQKIFKAILSDEPEINPQDALQAAAALAAALEGKGYKFNPDAEVKASVEPGSINALVCISNSGFPVPTTGLNVWCATFTTDPDVNDVHIKYKTPSGNEVDVLNILSPPKGLGITPPYAYAFPLTMTEAGQWKVKVFYTNNGALEVSLLASWMVLPESAIGAVAIVGTSIGAVAVYSLRKRQTL